MNPFYTQLIVETAKRQLKKKDVKPAPKALEKEIQGVWVEVFHFARNFAMILMGVMMAAFGLKGFLLPNSFLDGGVTGISLIATELTGVSLSIFIVVINLPFVAMAFWTISRPFAYKSILAIVLLSLAVHFIPVATITDDKLLIAVFGGFFLGLGIGLAIRGGAVLDGTEVLAVFVSRRTSLSIGDVILIFNLIIFSFAAYVFSLEIALYAILTYMAAAKTVDFVITGIEEYVGVTIITEKSEEVRLAIIEKLGRGCTIFMGKKGFAKRGVPLKETEIVYTLLTRLEVARLKAEIDKVDKNAFVVMHSIKDAKGGMIKKRPLK